MFTIMIREKISRKQYRSFTLLFQHGCYTYKSSGMKRSDCLSFGSHWFGDCGQFYSSNFFDFAKLYSIYVFDFHNQMNVFEKQFILTYFLFALRLFCFMSFLVGKSYINEHLKSNHPILRIQGRLLCTILNDKLQHRPGFFSPIFKKQKQWAFQCSEPPFESTDVHGI